MADQFLRQRFVSLRLNQGRDTGTGTLSRGNGNGRVTRRGKTGLRGYGRASEESKDNTKMYAHKPVRVYTNIARYMQRPNLQMETHESSKDE